MDLKKYKGMSEDPMIQSHQLSYDVSSSSFFYEETLGVALEYRNGAINSRS